MYRLLIKKIIHNSPYTEEVQQRRCKKVVEFWAEEGEKYIQLVKKLNSKEDASFDDLLLYFGYWFRFKLLCEGQEPTFENVVLNGFDLYTLKLFIMDVNSLEDD